MAHVVGVPKREPCQKCGNPVFLAERLPIGKALYQRTCLRCARCDTQLTPGSFYETENDGEFCCETCPDEEHKRVDQEATAESRKSFQDKLAIFQSDGKGLLEKSLSDEMKSKSLKRLSDIFSQNVSTNGGGASGEVPGVIDAESDSGAESDSSADTDVSAPPLPLTAPPIFDADSSIPQIIDDPVEQQIPAISHQSESQPNPPQTITSHSSLEQLALSRPTSTTETVPPTKDVEGNSEKSFHAEPSNELQSVANVTKDTNEQHENHDQRVNDEETKPNQNIPNNQMVRSRLSQFEALLENEEKRQSLRNPSNVIDKQAMRCQNDCKNDENLNEQLSNENVPTVDQLTISDKFSELNVNSDVCLKVENENEIESKSENESEANHHNELATEEPLSIDSYSKPIPMKRNSKDSSSGVCSLPPTPMKRKSKSPSAGESVTADVIISENQVIAGTSIPIGEAEKAPNLAEDIQVNSETIKYPEDLNPFGSDDENDKIEDPRVAIESKSKVTSNPFDSSDEEVELLKPSSKDGRKAIAAQKFR